MTSVRLFTLSSNGEKEPLIPMKASVCQRKGFSSLSDRGLIKNVYLLNFERAYGVGFFADGRELASTEGQIVVNFLELAGPEWEGLTTFCSLYLGYGRLQLDSNFYKCVADSGVVSGTKLDLLRLVIDGNTGHGMLYSLQFDGVLGGGIVSSTIYFQLQLRDPLLLPRVNLRGRCYERDRTEEQKRQLSIEMTGFCSKKHLMKIEKFIDLAREEGVPTPEQARTRTKYLMASQFLNFNRPSGKSSRLPKSAPPPSTLEPSGLAAGLEFFSQRDRTPSPPAPSPPDERRPTNPPGGIPVGSV